MSSDPGAFSLGEVGGSGPALLCLHGLTGMPSDVRPPDELVKSLGMACVGPLLPGHGTSVEELSRTTHEQWLAVVLDAYDALAVTHKRVYVLGLSLGGVLALQLCALRPLSGALLLAAPLDLGFARRTLVRYFSPFVFAVPRTPGMVDPAARLRDVGYRRMPLRAVSQLIALQRRVVAVLPEIRVPLRLLYSRRDATVNPADAQQIARLASAADVEVEYLERSGHVLTLDLERDRVAAWIVDQLVRFEHRDGCG
jgi:carboxylesterase